MLYYSRMVSKLTVPLALLADFANGIFATLIASYVSGESVAWWHFVIGALLAMSPDLDAIPELLRRGRVAASPEHPTDHRSGLHYPILFVVAGAAAAYLAPFWGTLVLAATLLHFVNDLYGTGWGIELLWPLSTRRFKFFSRRANQLKSMLVANGRFAELPVSERRLRLLVSWTRAELPLYIKTYGVDDWIPPTYLRLNAIMLVEYSLFLVALLLMARTLLY